MYREQYEQITLAKIKIRKPDCLMKYEDVKFKHDRILLSYDKEGNPTICNNKDRI